MRGKIEGSGKRERPNMRWVDFKTEARDLRLHGLSKAVEDRTLWTSPYDIHRGLQKSEPTQWHMTISSLMPMDKIGLWEKLT